MICRRTADVRAYGYVELFVLSKEDVLNAIKEYPLAQKILARYGRSRLKQDNNRKDGPRTDTTTTDSETEIANSFLNANGSQGSNMHEQRNSPGSRSSSFRRSLTRKGSEMRSCVKVKIPTDANVSESRLLQISDQFRQSSSIVHDTMMSVINPVVNPVSSVVIGVKSPSFSPRPSVLINTNAIRAESEDLTKIGEEKHKRKYPREDDRVLQFIDASKRELLQKMEHILKKKMVTIKLPHEHAHAHTHAHTHIHTHTLYIYLYICTYIHTYIHIHIYK